jgi:hypothetical protein
MEKSKKQSNPVCYTPSSEPFRLSSFMVFIYKKCFYSDPVTKEALHVGASSDHGATRIPTLQLSLRHTGVSTPAVWFQSASSSLVCGVTSLGSPRRIPSDDSGTAYCGTSSPLVKYSHVSSILVLSPRGVPFSFRCWVPGGGFDSAGPQTSGRLPPDSFMF